VKTPKIGVFGSGWVGDDSTTFGKTPRYFQWDFDKKHDITFYVDNSIPKGISEKCHQKYAWLVESRSITPHAVNFVKENVQLVSQSYITLFTHYKEIANLAPNFQYIPSHGYLIEDVDIHEKTKLVSMVSSAKRMCNGHNYRLDWVDKLKGKVDLYGRGFNPVARKEEALNDYMFSVTIENDEYETYWTEKILDCFATGTIPVYHGAPDVGDFFNMDGVIILDDDFDIDSLTPELYYSKMDAIKDNFNRAIKLNTVEDLMIERGLVKLTSPTSKKQCFIKTIAGLGDILYVHKIAQYYYDEGYEVIWAISPVYLDMMKKYVKSDFHYCTMDEAEALLPESHKGYFLDVRNSRTHVYDNNFVYLALNYAHDLVEHEYKERIMYAKYKSLNVDIDPSDWHRYINVERDLEKESELFEKVVKHEKYCLVNRQCGTKGTTRDIPFPVDTKLPIIEMRYIEDYTIFDWLLVVENATEFYSVETSLHYVLDIPNLVNLDVKKIELFSQMYPQSYYVGAINDVLINKELYNLN
tara:strand:+ start:24974 stop:26551 length:1578 start_codon:yes stop_codon:yes gene_type:complete